MRDLRCAGRNLVIVERREDVLWIASVDAIAMAVEHIHVHEVRPWIDFFVRAQAAAASDDSRGAADFRVHPNLIRIDGALRERMAELDRAQPDFQEIFLPRLQWRNIRTQ